jgi:hypothetical protein
MPDTGAPATRACPDCAVTPGQRHKEGCDVARCVVCGQQQLQCDPEAEHGLTGPSLPPMQTWTGEWPGYVECREWGWWGRWTVVTEYSHDGRPNSGPFVPCPADHPDARTDLNRLALEAARGRIVWSRERERYVTR